MNKVFLPFILDKLKKKEEKLQEQLQIELIPQEEIEEEKDKKETITIIELF